MIYVKRKCLVLHYVLSYLLDVIPDDSSGFAVSCMILLDRRTSGICNVGMFVVRNTEVTLLDVVGNITMN